MTEVNDTLSKFAAAMQDLLTDEAFRYANPGEQAVTTQLCQLMVPLFAEWNVNAEWNRREAEAKMLAYGFDDQVEALRLIRPDIIVHRIGLPENLLVVEAKRVENRLDAQDRAKLIAMTNAAKGYGYLIGIRVVIDMQNGSVADLEVFTNGSRSAELTEFLEGQLQAHGIR